MKAMHTGSQIVYTYKYVAFDNRTFTDKEECLAYEETFPLALRLCVMSNIDPALLADPKEKMFELGIDLNEERDIEFRVIGTLRDVIEKFKDYLMGEDDRVIRMVQYRHVDDISDNDLRAM